MYDSINELPKELRESMPDEACELYRASYNRIFDREVRAGGENDARMARTAHEGAMLSIESEYDIDEQGNWHRAPIGKDMDRIGPAADDQPRSNDSG